MLIINDLGNEVVNIDLVFAVSIVQTQEGQTAVLVQGMVNWKAVIVAGSKERCERALKLITDGVKQRQHILDLVGILGPRSDIAVAQSIIVPGNGEGRPG